MIIEAILFFFLGAIFIKMGVKDLWSILEPCSQRQTLDDLKGLTVAVDLGFWACQLSAAVQNPNVPKPYLK